MLWARKRDCIDTLGNAQIPRRANIKHILTALPLTVVDTLLMWQERAFQRRALRGMDDRLLRDIGLSPLDAEREGRKPFWRA